MTIQTFIERAIEGGYKFLSNPLLSDEDRERLPRMRPGVIESPSFLIGMRHAVLLDPSAWKAVGKVEGWHCIIGFEYQEERLANYDKVHFDHRAGQMPQWKYNMHRMIDALADGKSLEDYIATL